jgi:hypothetical protein
MAVRFEFEPSFPGIPLTVIPAQAGIHLSASARLAMDPRLRGDDGWNNKKLCETLRPLRLCGFTFLKKYKQPALPFLSMDPRVKPEGDGGRGVMEKL